MFDPVTGQLPRGVGDKWPPVAHAQIHREVEGPAKGFRLRHADLSERRFSDQRVAMTYFFDHSGRKRAASRDVFHELGNLVGRIRAAMGKEKHGMFPRTHRATPSAPLRKPFMD